VPFSLAYFLPEMSQVPAILNPTEQDMQYMLACSVHLGRTNIDPTMRRYVWKRRKDGVHIFDLAKTWQKLILAARVIATIENPADVFLISAQQKGQKPCHKFAQYTRATALSGRFTPGTFTNQIQEKFVEPRLLFVCDPRTDHQPLTEASYVNIPSIALCNSDSSARCVEIVIPCNNQSASSVGLIFWLLAREVLRLKGEIPRTQPWDVIVDAFFYKSPEELERKQAEEAAHAPEEKFRPPEPVLPAPTEGGWTTEPTSSWGDSDQYPPAQMSEWTESDNLAVAAPAGEPAWSTDPILASWDAPTTAS
jgi:small subunit ribosomal protein SAe